MSNATVWRGGDETSDVENMNSDLDWIFTLFSHPRRRALLHLLRNTETESVWTTNLAARLAQIEADADEDLHDAAEEIAVSLRHNHLPKLAEAGLVDVDSAMTTLTYRGDDRIDDLLQWSRRRGDVRTQLSNE